MSVPLISVVLTYPVRSTVVPLGQVANGGLYGGAADYITTSGYTYLAVSFTGTCEKEGFCPRQEGAVAKEKDVLRRIS